jgi:alpha-L-rhamnosidase
MNLPDNFKSTLDLSPAKWIWYPSERTLQNTFVFFRKEIQLDELPETAKGWIIADSRYILYVNGERIQWGPSPSDPRWPEVDPADITKNLKTGKNVIGIQVLYYGQGDGTWPIGKPGLLFNMSLKYYNGNSEQIISDNKWDALLPLCWIPGHYKRWYIRSLQEEFDARKYPYGWNTTDYPVNSDWVKSMELSAPADKPVISSDYTDYLYDTMTSMETGELRYRSVPLLKEIMVNDIKISESFFINWKRPIKEYFEFMTPDSFSKESVANPVQLNSNEWEISIDAGKAAALTFELNEQVVGFPFFTIEAKEGTVIELLVHEAHALGGPLLINSHFHSWSRFICKEGLNYFETFDYESCRWIQLHIHDTVGKVKIKNIGMRRRLYAWNNEPEIKVSDENIQKLINASVNTLYNCAQETLVDGMARERQQYSGDCGHQIHAIYYTFGNTESMARFVRTYSQGLTLDGYFLDSWPGYDRLARLFERQMQLTCWGPLLDHGIGFNFDCYYYYLYTGDIKPLNEAFPRLVKFFHYLTSIKEKDGLLPVENIGIPSVWIDHDAYKQQRHKQCAFNLYAIAMLKNAFIPLCRLFNDTGNEKAASLFANALLKATIKKFWSSEKSIFINNLPWVEEEKELRCCDRSLATALLFDLCPGNKIEDSLKMLAECPLEMGLSYPANANWRLWALAKYGRTDILTKDFRERWAVMDSVKLNNTLQEYWKTEPDSTSQWSHCPVVPLYTLFMNIAGIEPLEPGFTKCCIRPQPADLEEILLTPHTIQGPIYFKSSGKYGERIITIKLPKGCSGELALDKREKINLEKINKRNKLNLSYYKLEPDTEIEIKLSYT